MRRVAGARCGVPAAEAMLQWLVRLRLRKAWALAVASRVDAVGAGGGAALAARAGRAVLRWAEPDDELGESEPRRHDPVRIRVEFMAPALVDARPAGWFGLTALAR